MWDSWTIPRLDTKDHIERGHPPDYDLWWWEGNGKLAFMGERMLWRLGPDGNKHIITDGKLMLRIVTTSESFPPFGYIVMRESFQARYYQYVLLPLLGIVQSIFRRLLWTAVIWDLVYCEMACAPQWRDFRPLRWVRTKWKRVT